MNSFSRVYKKCRNSVLLYEILINVNKHNDEKKVKNKQETTKSDFKGSLSYSIDSVNATHIKFEYQSNR